ncbi:TIGR04197 family type VII secretion effector [Oceanobacillus saliphilus]|uniref:TIGR04197 family type VII secretion effector n=1 Tax=Oceanobacillus saliphilus TaxID=2925834 RepID=UPI00201DD649|nr:TIGR04197 family type VII secretion effector [Oceanobacillus saliphilus]
MAEEVGINSEVFRSNIEKLRGSLSNLESKIHANQTFKKTNITPFTNDLENIIKAVELINKYKMLLDEDISTLNNVGEQMRQNDEDLARQHNHVSNGTKAIRA